jgi:hypothetical protein
MDIRWNTKNELSGLIFSLIIYQIDHFNQVEINIEKPHELRA